MSTPKMAKSIDFSHELLLPSTAAVVKHFDDFHEDQFDFHAYCVRKVTLRAYTEVLRFEDNLWGEDYYFSAANGMIGIYLHLYDNPSIMEQDKEPDYSKMTGGEKKKAKAIARKKRVQAEKKEAEKKKEEEAEATENGGTQKKKAKTSPVDEDPEGKELLAKDPLEEANNFSSILSKHCPRRFGAWTLQYDVSIRREKRLLALQALFKMRSLDVDHPGYFSRLVDFGLKMANFGELSGAVQRVVTEEFAKLLNEKSLADYVSEAAGKARKDPSVSLSSRVEIAQGLVKTKSESAGTASILIVEGGMASKGVDVESCRAALEALKAFGAETEASTKKWISAVKERFPLITDFS
jgi:hypothetical protein